MLDMNIHKSVVGFIFLHLHSNLAEASTFESGGGQVLPTSSTGVLTVRTPAVRDGVPASPTPGQQAHAGVVAGPRGHGLEAALQHAASLRLGAGGSSEGRQRFASRAAQLYIKLNVYVYIYIYICA